jgi:small-conductance mechanosensitive channel
VGGKPAAQRHCSRLQDKLKIVGMGDVAASLGIATGFVAEGVSSVLSPARASDITLGDRIIADGVSGELTAIELRKNRVQTDDDETVVVASHVAERRW